MRKRTCSIDLPLRPTPMRARSATPPSTSRWSLAPTIRRAARPVPTWSLKRKLLNVGSPGSSSVSAIPIRALPAQELPCWNVPGSRSRSWTILPRRSAWRHTLPGSVLGRPLCHAQARCVARRGDRAGRRVEPLDHRGHGPLPCPRSPRAGRRDPRRWRDLARRHPPARRAPARPFGPFAPAIRPYPGRSAGGCAGDRFTRSDRGYRGRADALCRRRRGHRGELRRARPGRRTAPVPRAHPDRRGSPRAGRYRAERPLPPRTGAGRSPNGASLAATNSPLIAVSAQADIRRAI